MCKAFQFKQFQIKDNNCAMKTGTDAVLIGAWADCNNAKKILDIGTGSGIIALMLAQKCNALINAIDIDEESIKNTVENIYNSKWPNQIIAQNISLQNFLKNNTESYSHIVCNPPYFNNSLKNPDARKKLVRHTDSLSFDELINGVNTLLDKNGSFFLILPTNESLDFIQKALISSLYCNEKLNIKPKPGKAIKRLMMKFEKQNKKQIINELIIRNEDNSYTSEYIEFTKDYYLDL